MRLDSTDYLPLDAPQCLGATPAGATFATSSGDIIELECFGDGAFRLRSGPNTRPDYGIVTGSARACTSDLTQAHRWTFDSGHAVLELSGPPLALRLLWHGRPVLTSATDERADGSPRLPALGRLRHGGLWSAAFALASGEAIYGLGEKFGPLDKRGQLVHSRVAQAAGVNTGLSSRSAPFGWSPGIGAGAWGVFVHTPGTVTHAVGNPEWSHRSYAVMVEDEALDLFLFAAADPAGIVDLYTQVTGRPRAVPRWSLGLWIGRAGDADPGDAEALVAHMRGRRLPCDVVSLAVRGAGSTNAGFDFTWDALHDRDPAETVARIKSHQVRVCVREAPTIAVGTALYD
ncbi:MAG: TIM-barrel domain-containing protein, partial [Casimicrobiaceae bacterium]